MNKSKIFFGLAVAIIVGIIGFKIFRPVSYENFPPKNPGPWIAFGDSLTSGIGADEGAGSYPAQLGQTLGVTIKNLGRPGETTQDGLSRIGEVEAEKPRVVLLCFGGNDTLRSVDHGQTFGNLETMIDRLHAQEVFVVLIGVRSASIFDKYETPFEELAKRKRVFYVPNILSGVLGTPSLMSDQIHPNDAGYSNIAGRIAKLLEPMMVELK